MFGLSGFEIAIILFFGFLIFGPDKLPQIARTIGRGLKQFRTAQEQMNNVIKAEIYDPVKDLEPLINPFSGFSLDNILEGDSKKPDVSKTEAKKDEAKVLVSKSGETKTISGTKEADAGQEALKISNADLKAAIKDDAEKAKKKALRETAEATAGSTPSALSFAERRARLEKEHARMKAEQAKAEQAKLAAAEQASAEQTQAEQAQADTVKTSDAGKEDEKGN